MRLLLLSFWPLLPLLSPRPSPRLLLTPTFCTEDTMDMVLDMDTLVLDTMVLDTEFMESALLMPSQKLTPTCTEDTMDMVLDMDTLVLDTTVLDTEFMESALLMPNQKLTPTFCMEDMLDTMDMPDTMDTPMVDMPTMDKLLPLISKWTANHPCFLYQ